MANNKVIIEIDLSDEIEKITKEIIESEKDSDKTYPAFGVPRCVYPDLETDKETWKRIKRNKKLI